MSLKRYFIVLLLTFIGLAGANQVYIHAARLSCWSGGYAQNGWMAYCNSSLYGVFDPDAIWFELEPEIATVITKAKVLTLTDSRLQNALSLGGASEWFAKRGIPAYFLGLPVQTSGFGEALIEKFHPEASVIVFSASPYFTGKPGNFLPGALAHPDKTLASARALQAFQKTHEQFCTALPWACGHNFAYFRSRVDGHWIFPPLSQKLLIGQASLPNDQVRFPVHELPDEAYPQYPEFLQNARAMFAKLKLRPDCIVVTNLPADHDDTALARLISSSLGVTLIDPQLDNLATFDRSHLTPESSVRWTRAFLEQLEPVISRCAPMDTSSTTVVDNGAGPH